MQAPGPLEDAPYGAAALAEFADMAGLVVWHERHEDKAIAIKWLSDAGREWALLLQDIEGLWLPVCNSLFFELPYEGEKDCGVWFMTEPVMSPVERVRTQYGDQTLDRPVVDGFLATVLWDTVLPKDKTVTFSQIRVDGVWQNPLMPTVPETRETFIRHYYLYYDRTLSESEKEQYSWTWDVVEGNHCERELELALAIVDAADISSSHHQWVLGCLGAGPLENMMSHWLLDRIAGRLPQDECLVYALNGIYMQYEPKDVQQRLSVLLDGGKDPGCDVSKPYDPLKA